MTSLTRASLGPPAPNVDFKAVVGLTNPEGAMKRLYHFLRDHADSQLLRSVCTRLQIGHFMRRLTDLRILVLHLQ